MLKLLVTVVAATAVVGVNVVGVHRGVVVDRTSKTVLLKGRLQWQVLVLFFHLDIIYQIIKELIDLL